MTDKYSRQKLWKIKNRKQCPVCGTLMDYRSSLCKSCAKQTIDLDSTTIADMKEKGNSNTSKYSYIRYLARKTYLLSDKPKQCTICGYSLHFEVCHIHAIQDFDAATPLSVVNNLDNLIALCKNHHWELDNGLLTL